MRIGTRRLRRGFFRRAILGVLVVGGMALALTSIAYKFLKVL